LVKNNCSGEIAQTRSKFYDGKNTDLYSGNNLVQGPKTLLILSKWNFQLLKR